LHARGLPSQVKGVEHQEDVRLLQEPIP